MDKDYILEAVREYADEYMIELSLHMPKGYFEQCSYQRWAVNEVIRRIGEAEDISPVLTVENFIHMISGFLCRRGKINPICSIAYDVATDILDFLIALGE